MRFKYEELSTAPLLINSIYEGGSKGNPAADDPLTILFRVDGFTKSVGNRSGFRKSNKEYNGKSTKEIAFVVIFSTKKIKEWKNIYDKSTGTFIYYGDNKVPGKDYLVTKQKGNELLKDLYERANRPASVRKTIPPLFVFEATGVGMNVEFLGVAVPGIKGKTLKESLVLKTFGEHPQQFQNYEAYLTMINIEPSGVSRKWLAELKNYNGNSVNHAPKEWVNFVENGLGNVTPLNLKNKEIIDSSHDITLPSERQYLRKVRTTQGKFRESLLAKGPFCKICRMDIPELLVASHIKPWKDCNDREKNDFYNGFLLCPSHNAAFDGGYISFDEKGKIIISKLLNQRHRELLRIKETLQIQLGFNHLEYTKWHLKHVFIDNRVQRA